MKFTICLLSLISAPVFAANKPVYEVVYHLLEKGQEKSASVIIEEGKAGEINSITDNEKDSLSATVKPSSANLLSLDYRFKINKRGKSIELAKTEVVLAPGSTETSEFKDYSGNDFQLKITVSKK